MFPPAVDVRSLPGIAALSTRSRRVLVVTAIGLAAAAYADQFFTHPRTGIMASDFGQVWFGSRTLLAGGNPYDVVGPGGAFDWPFPLLYPLTALLAAAPLAWLPLRLAEAVRRARGRPSRMGSDAAHDRQPATARLCVVLDHGGGTVRSVVADFDCRCAHPDARVWRSPVALSPAIHT